MSDSVYMRKYLNILNENATTTNYRSVHHLCEDISRDVVLEEDLKSSLKKGAEKAINFVKKAADQPDEIMRKALAYWVSSGGDKSKGAEIIKKTKRYYPSLRLAAIAATAIISALVGMGGEAMASSDIDSMINEFDKQTDEAFEQFDQNFNDKTGEMLDSAEQGDASYIEYDGHQVRLDKDDFSKYFSDGSLSKLQQMMMQINDNKHATDFVKQYGFSSPMTASQFLSPDHELEQATGGDQSMQNDLRFKRLQAFQAAIDTYQAMKDGSLRSGAGGVDASGGTANTVGGTGARSGAGTNPSNF